MSAHKARGGAERGPARELPGQSAPPQRAAGDAPDWQLLTLAALLPLLAAILLFQLDVPLGKPDKFVYLYSPPEIFPRRLAALPAAIFLAALLGCGIRFLFSEHKWGRRAGLFLVLVGCVGVGCWAYCAPPDFRSQHFFNMQSPSHDGAFLAEAFHLRRGGVREYLRDFPQRARTPPEKMRGSRVISNPPGTTLVAVATISLLERSPLLTRWVYAVGADEPGLPPDTSQLVTMSLGFSTALLLLWLLAAPLLYWSGRLFFSTPAAAVFAVICLFSPMTLLFTPGKDPAQLLTVALLLWLWMRAWRRGQRWAAALAGGAFVLACLVSLVHVWIAAIVFVATTLNTPSNDRRPFALRTCLPAIVGALVVIGALALFCDLNFFASARAAARAQAGITRGESAMPFVWQMLGIPLFLLFAGPALWCVGLWLPRRRLDDQDARFGRHLLLGAAVVMLATVGFTNLETPRLWIPFTPLLLLGAALQLPAFRHPNRKAAGLLAALVFVQIATAAAQWSLMDVREAETRLLRDGQGRARFFE